MIPPDVGGRYLFIGFSANKFWLFNIRFVGIKYIETVFYYFGPKGNVWHGLATMLLKRGFYFHHVKDKFSTVKRIENRDPLESSFQGHSHCNSSYVISI